MVVRVASVVVAVVAVAIVAVVVVVVVVIVAVVVIVDVILADGVAVGTARVGSHSERMPARTCATNSTLSAYSCSSPTPSTTASTTRSGLSPVRRSRFDVLPCSHATAIT